MEQNKTILVVDDDAKIRLLLRRCLESDGYRVVEAETEAEVVQQLASNTVDLITLDLQLGAENGLHIAAKVRETSNVPIVMVTGKGDVIDKVVGLEIGADDYIAKTVSSARSTSPHPFRHSPQRNGDRSSGVGRPGRPDIRF